MNFCTEDFTRLILLGRLFAEWFFAGCCFILLWRPVFTVCESFVPNLAMTFWCLELPPAWADPVGLGWGDSWAEMNGMGGSS